MAQNQPASAPAQSSPASQESNSGSSLANAAKNTKAQKATHAKKVFTDDDMDAMAGPLPRLKMTGPDNLDDVIAAITKYKSEHTAEETENTVHAWFDRYDEMLSAAIEGNRDLSALRTVNQYNANDLCQESGDYQQCQYQQMANARGMRSDQTEMISNTQLMMRIQQSFSRVRMALEMNGLHYKWFKIRVNSYPDSYQ